MLLNDFNINKIYSFKEDEYILIYSSTYQHIFHELIYDNCITYFNTICILIRMNLIIYNEPIIDKIHNIRIF